VVIKDNYNLKRDFPISDIVAWISYLLLPILSFAAQVSPPAYVFSALVAGYTSKFLKIVREPKPWKQATLLILQ